MPQGTSTATAPAPAAAAVATTFYAKLAELSEQHERDWLDAGCPSGNGLGCHASPASEALFVAAFEPVQNWLAENEDFELWTEYSDRYLYWATQVKGDVMDQVRHARLAVKYAPPPPTEYECSEEDLESKADELATLASRECRVYPRTSEGELAALTGYEYANASVPLAPTAPPAPVEDPEPPKPPHMVYGNHPMTREECNSYCSLGPFTEEEWEMLLCGETRITEADLCRLLNKPFSTACMVNTAGFSFYEVDPTTYPRDTPVKCPPQCPDCRSSSLCKLTVADFIVELPPSRSVAGLPEEYVCPYPPEATRATAGGGAGGYEEQEDDDEPVRCPRNCGDCGGLRYGCGLTRGDIRRMYSTPEPEPEPEDDCRTPPPYYIQWDHHKRGKEEHEFPTICTDVRKKETLDEAAAELTAYATKGFYGWKEKASLDYFRIYNVRGKELHLDELPPLIVTASSDRDLGLRAEQPPRPRLEVADVERIVQELIPTLTDDQFPLRIEFFHCEEEWHDSLLLALNISTEKSRKEWRKNAIEEANHRARLRECCDYGDDDGW